MDTYGKGNNLRHLNWHCYTKQPSLRGSFRIQTTEFICHHWTEIRSIPFNFTWTPVHGYISLSANYEKYR